MATFWLLKEVQRKAYSSFYVDGISLNAVNYADDFADALADFNGGDALACCGHILDCLGHLLNMGTQTRDWIIGCSELSNQETYDKWMRAAQKAFNDSDVFTEVEGP
tara:strand:+ start:3109 stop:3429 length:321 start_codon:yes stop_codon:yes gene_type:complete